MWWLRDTLNGDNPGWHNWLRIIGVSAVVWHITWSATAGHGTFLM